MFVRNYSEGLEDKVEFAPQVDTVIALKIKDLFNNEKTVEALTIKQLNELIATQKLRGDANVMYAQIEKGIGWNIGIGIALAFSYILFLRFSEMFVYTNTLPPGIALWIPNLLYAIIAAALYRYAPK